MKVRLLGIALAYALVPALFGRSDYAMGLVVASLTIGTIALAWALLGNLGGMVSFGHSAFFGVGAYVSALLVVRAGVPTFAAMIAAGIGAALASIVMLPALRLRGPYFALAILAYSQIFRILATELTPITGGAAGVFNVPRLPTVLGVHFGTNVGSYLVVGAIAVLFAWAYHLIRSSHYGLALRAMKESEDATRVVGMNSTLAKGLMLLVSAAMTGVVGAFNSHYIGFVEPDYAFSSEWTVMPIIAAMFGGYRTIAGPVVGAVSVYLVDQVVFKAMMPKGHHLVLGALLAGMIIVSPVGLLPVLGRWLKRGSLARA